MWSPLTSYGRRQGHLRLLALKAHMDGKGNPKTIQNQLCHSPVVKAMTQPRVERQDSQATGDHCSVRGCEAFLSALRRPEVELLPPKTLSTKNDQKSPGGDPRRGEGTRVYRG